MCRTLRIQGLGGRVIELLILEAAIACRACTHGTTGQDAHHNGFVQSFAPRLVQSLVLQDLLGYRLRQFFQHALDNRALTHLAQYAFVCWLGQRVDCSGRGAVCGILGHALSALCQHHVGIANAQTVRNLVTGKAQGTCGQSGTGGQRGLFAGQLAVFCLLADLLGG
ncbi:MAG: hypothetical protein RR687_10925 [Comamonas sp.]